MAILVDPLIILTGKDKTAWEVYETNPVEGDFDGQIIINSTDNVFRVWYNGVWNTLGITITPGEVPEPETGNPIGLLLSLTYEIA